MFHAKNQKSNQKAVWGAVGSSFYSLHIRLTPLQKPIQNRVKKKLKISLKACLLTNVSKSNFYDTIGFSCIYKRSLFLLCKNKITDGQLTLM